jgi:flavoprotein
MDPPEDMVVHLKRSNSSSSSLHFKPRADRKLRLLVAATGPRDTSWASALVVRLSKNAGIELRAIVDDVIPRLNQTVIVMPNRSMIVPCHASAPAAAQAEMDDVEFYRQQAFELVEWADLMVLAPIDADNIAKMMAGIADTFLLEVVRGWDTAKKILLVPGMSTHMWENPMTKRQMSKIHRKWHWVRAAPPILWHYDANPKNPNPKRIVNWSGFNDVLGIIKNQADLMGLGRDVDVASQLGFLAVGGPGVQSKLPPEIWTIILDFAQDWELAQALGVYTNSPMPAAWSLAPRDPHEPLKVYEHELEWLVLTCDTPAICKKLLQSPASFHDLPALVIKLIIRFSLIDVLAWMEANRPDLFKAFDGKVLPTKASAYYGRPDVLDYWKASRFFHGPNKSTHHDTDALYDVEAMDGASKNGYVRVLDWWWRHAGLPLKFTEAALEQASGKGHLLVLEWWRDAAAQDDRIVLRPGKALLWAAQHGQVAVIRWWVASGIPIAHGDSVAKMASRWGQVEVLELWRQLKGDDKLAFDSEVLIQATIHQHVDVLEWWRRFAHGELEGMDGRRHRVEYRTCDIEEALEDSIGDQERVRKWWARNGLNLGLRNIEWMRTKCL